MKKVFIAGVALALAAGAHAQVKIGVVVSATGPAASLGIPEKNTVGLCPKTIGGKDVDYIVLDDATDTTNAVQVTKKLIGENQVDIRADICANLDRLGIVLDSAKNQATKATEAIISAASSSVKVMVIPTNEELVVAREAKRLLEERSSQTTHGRE